MAMNELNDSSQMPKQPWSFLAAKWYAYIFATSFLLYGGVNIILGILDRDYSNFPASMVFLVVGIVLMTLCIAYRDRKVWGWYGLVGANILVVILALIGYENGLNFLFFVLSGAAVGLLFMPQTKAEIF